MVDKNTHKSRDVVRSWEPLQNLSKEDLIGLPYETVAREIYRLVEEGRNYDEIRSIGYLLGVYACHGKH